MIAVRLIQLSVILTSTAVSSFSVQYTSECFTSLRNSVDVVLSCGPTEQIYVDGSTFGLSTSDCKVNQTVNCTEPGPRELNGLCNSKPCIVTLYRPPVNCDIGPIQNVSVEISYGCLGSVGQGKQTTIGQPGPRTLHPPKTTPPTWTRSVTDMSSLLSTEREGVDLSTENNSSSTNDVSTMTQPSTIATDASKRNRENTVFIYIGVITGLSAVTTIIILILICLTIYIKRLMKLPPDLERSGSRDSTSDDYDRLEDIQSPSTLQRQDITGNII